MGNRGTSLRAFLVFPAALFLVVAVGVSVYQRDAAADDARKTALADARFAARLAARELDTAITQVTTDVGTTAANPALAGVFAVSEGCTLNFVASAPLAKGHLDIVAADGRVLCSSLEANLDLSYAGDGWLNAALRGPLVDGFALDRRTNERSVVIASPVGDRGVLVTFVELDSIGPGLATSFGGPRRLEFQLTRGDRVVSKSTEGDFDVASRFSGTATVDATKWRITAGVTKSQALAAAHSVSNRQLVAVAIALPIALATLYFLYRGLAYPIAKLSSGVRKATEDLSAEPIDVAGPREISLLVDDFNTLIAAARNERDLKEQLRRAERVDEQERELRLLADRERIGRDLHDTVIQHLFATGMALDSLTNRITEPEVREKVSRAVDDIDATIREVRAAIFDVERGGSESASDVLRDVVAKVGEGLGFQPLLAFSGPVDEAVPAHVADQMAAALRESLTNAARHASAGQVEVGVTVADDIVLTVRDNGVGIDNAHGSGGLGLNSMRARAERLGGDCKVDRHPSGGTLVEWRVPRGATASSR